MHESMKAHCLELYENVNYLIWALFSNNGKGSLFKSCSRAFDYGGSRKIPGKLLKTCSKTVPICIKVGPFHFFYIKPVYMFLIIVQNVYH